MYSCFLERAPIFGLVGLPQGSLLLRFKVDRMGQNHYLDHLDI